MKEIKKDSYKIGLENSLINEISTTWMNTDFISSIKVEEELEIYIDENIVDKLNFSKQDLKIIMNESNCIISRSIRNHDVFPNPEIILKIQNIDNKKHVVKIKWRIKSKNNYALIQEKLSEQFTNYKQNYLFFLLIPSFYNTDQINSSIHEMETTLNPNQSDELHITLFFSRNSIDTLGFSGIGFLIDKNDQEGAIGAIGVDIFGKIETKNASFPIHSLFSPIFWMDNGKISEFESLSRVIKKTPIKKLLTFIDMDVEIKSKFEEIGINLVKIENFYDCKTIDIQYTIDKLLNRITNFNEICLISDNIISNLSLAPIFARLGSRIMFYNSKSIKTIKKINPNFVAIIASDKEIPKKVDKKLKNETIITRVSHPPKNRNAIYQMLFLSRYIINKLILREFIDPDDSEWELFLSKLKMNSDEVFEKYLKEFNLFTYDQLHLAEAAVNGPQIAILATAAENEWQNAAIGANYSKGKNSICYIIDDNSPSEKNQIKYLLKSIDENLLNYKILLEKSEELGNIIVKNIPRIALDFSEYITLFPADASIPFELIFYQGRYGLESISTKYSIGRIVGDDIFDTSLLATSSIMYSLQTHDQSSFLIVGNPTKDLEYSTEETTAIAMLLNALNFPFTYLSGKPIPDEMLLSIKNIIEGGIGGKINLDKFKKLDIPTKSRFSSEINKADIIHFSGHGGIDKNGPFLVLSDDIFTINDIPSNLSNRPFIFANACLAGLSIDYEKNVSLASKFIEKGAIGYIGALWRVSDEVSDIIGSLFYDLLTITPVGSILRMLKEYCFTNMTDDYTALAFILSGDPSIHFHDPFYKSIEAFYYLRKSTDTINAGMITKGKEYTERTIRAFDIFKKELEERKTIKPELEIMYNNRILNFEALIVFLSGSLNTMEISNELPSALLKGDWGIYKKVGKGILKSSEISKDASKIAIDKGMKLNYEMNSDFLHQFGLLYLGIYEYFQENFDESLNIFEKVSELWQKSGKNLDDLWENLEEALVPIDIIDDQRSAMGYIVIGWLNLIDGLKEYSGSVNIDIIIDKFNKSLTSFQEVSKIQDTIMGSLVYNFYPYLFNDFGIIFLHSRKYNKVKEVFDHLNELSQLQCDSVDTLLENYSDKYGQEIERLKLQKEYFQSFIVVSQGFLHWNNFNESKINEEKELAIELIKKAITLTPNEYYKKKWNDLLDLL